MRNSLNALPFRKRLYVQLQRIAGTDLELVDADSQLENPSDGEFQTCPGGSAPAAVQLGLELLARLQSADADLDLGGLQEADAELIDHLEILTGAGPRTVPALAEVLETSRQAAQRLVDELCARKYVEQQTNPQHRRSVLIAVTESGRERSSASTPRGCGSSS